MLPAENSSARPRSRQEEARATELAPTMATACCAVPTAGQQSGRGASPRGEEGAWEMRHDGGGEEYWIHSRTRSVRRQPPPSAAATTIPADADTNSTREVGSVRCSTGGKYSNEDELSRMSLSELRKLAKRLGVRVRSSTLRSQLAAMLREASATGGQQQESFRRQQPRSTARSDATDTSTAVAVGAASSSEAASSVQRLPEGVPPLRSKRKPRSGGLEPEPEPEPRPEPELDSEPAPAPAPEPESELEQRPTPEPAAGAVEESLDEACERFDQLADQFDRVERTAREAVGVTM